MLHDGKCVILTVKIICFQHYQNGDGELPSPLYMYLLGLLMIFCGLNKKRLKCAKSELK